MVESAENMIWNSLKVTNLIKEINMIKVLSRLLLDRVPEKQIARLSLYAEANKVECLPDGQPAFQADQNNLQSSPLSPVKGFPSHELELNNLNLEPKDSLGDNQISNSKSPTVTMKPDTQYSVKRQLLQLFNDYNSRVLQSNPFNFIDLSEPYFARLVDPIPTVQHSSSTILISRPFSRVEKNVRVLNSRTVFAKTQRLEKKA